jgi:radical SAM protein with 4Fe4S-binding SPASM domain
LIATNAVLIDKNYAEQLKKSGLCYVQVSIDGTSDTHDFLRGKKGIYEKTLKGLKNLIDAGVYVSVAMVATKKNYNEIEHVLNVAKEYNASKFEILDYQQLGKAEDDFDLSSQERDALAEKLCILWKDIIKNKERISLLYKNPNFYNAMKKTFSDVGTANLFGASYPEEAMKLFKYSQRMKEGIFTIQDPFSPIATCCEAGLFGLFVDVDGTITPCPYMPLPIGNIFEDDFHSVWTESPVLNSLRDKSNLKGTCRTCDNINYCGGCRARAFNFTGDPLSADPLCSIVSK